MGNGLFGVVLIGKTAREDHVGGHSVALGEAVYVLVRLGGMHVVDA